MDQNELPEILMDFSQIPSDLLWALNDLPMNQNNLPGVLDSLHGALDDLLEVKNNS